MERLLRLLHLLGVAAVCAVPARADIFQWEYVDPHDPSQGKRESTLLAHDGYGLHAEPALQATGKNLANAFLGGGNLINAAFDSANLARAELDQANLTNTNFTGANLTGATLSDAIMTGANVKNANLSSTHITLEQLYSTVSHQNHDLTGAHFAGDDLSGANFAGQALTASSFYAAKLVGADFTNANLTSAEFVNADLSNANLTGANFTNGTVAVANLSGATLTGANFSGVNLIGTNLTGADIRDANLSRIVTMSGGASDGRPCGCGLSWWPSPGPTTHITGSGISLAQLVSTASYGAGDLSSVTLLNNNFNGGNLAGFNLTNANFTGATLTGADLSGTDTRGTTGLNSAAAVVTNLIRPNGHVDGLDLSAGQVLAVRDYDGDPTRTPTPLAPGPLQTQPDLTAVRVYEETFTTSTLSYAPNAAELTTRLTGPLAVGNRDIGFIDDESYDVFYSDANGALNAQGRYLTIEGVWRQPELRGDGGMNINEVELVFGGGNPHTQFGDFVASVQAGSICDPGFGSNCIPGSEALAVDHNLSTFPRFGQTSTTNLDERFRLTVGFGSASNAITVDQHFAMGPGGALRMVFEADAWDSTISFAAGVPVALGGSLELAFAAGVDPISQIGRTFNVFDWTGVSPTGAFAVSSPYVWDLSHLYTTGEVTFLAASGLPGDFNGDGVVNAADYTVWRDGLGKTYQPDALGVWKKHFGSGPGGGAALLASTPQSPVVPEPSAFFLLSVGLITVCATRRTRLTRGVGMLRSPVGTFWVIIAMLVVSSGRVRADAPQVGLTKIANPVWKPVDYQLFSAPATPFDAEFGHVYDTLLPFDTATTYVPHAPPYDTELSAGMIAGGYMNQAVFTPDAITLHPNGVYFAFMLVPDPGITGSSRDFGSGPVIPNSIFPIANNVDVWLDGVLVDRTPGADAIVPVQPRDVGKDGTSHLEFIQAIWFPWDDDLTVGPLGNYEIRLSIRDVGGSGWDMVAPFQVVPAITGDYDGNGTVGPEDYEVWKTNFGSTVLLAADGNGNHVIDAADYSVWRDHLGQVLAGGGGSALPSAAPLSAGVPEPSGLALVAAGVLSAVLSYRRRAS